MIIGKYVRQLLEEGKSVILPGFGNLEIKDTQGKGPTQGGRIDPPGLYIRFDAGYSKDDGLLAAACATGENMDEEEARQTVLELVDAIKFALDKGEVYSLSETGTFSRDDNGKVHVQPDQGWVLEPDQYGLESMDLLELDEEPEKEETQPEPETEGPTTSEDKVQEKSEAEGPASGPSSKPADESKKIKPVPPPPPASKSPVKHSPGVTTLHPPVRAKASPRQNIWRVIWIIAGSLIVILIALILIPVDWNQFQNKGRVKPGTEATGEDQNMEIQDGQEASGNGDNVDRYPGSEKENAGEVTGKTDSSTEGEINRVVEMEHNFFIIAGSFKHLMNASDLQDQLKARGYPAEVMITDNRMYRVSVSSYATKSDAERALAGIKADPGLEACWLLSN